MHTGQDTGIHRTLSQRNCSRQNNDGSGENASGSQTGDGSSDNENSRGWSDGGDQGTDLENDDSSQEDPFYRVIGIEFAKHQLQAANGEEVRAPIPSNIGKRAEFVGDTGNCGGENSTILEKLVSKLRCSTNK